MLYAFYGLYYGMAYGTASALVADLVPDEVRGTAYGTYNALLSVMAPDQLCRRRDPLAGHRAPGPALAPPRPSSSAASWP